MDRLEMKMALDVFFLLLKAFTHVFTISKLKRWDYSVIVTPGLYTTISVKTDSGERFWGSERAALQSPTWQYCMTA